MQDVEEVARAFGGGDDVRALVALPGEVEGTASSSPSSTSAAVAAAVDLNLGVAVVGAADGAAPNLCADAGERDASTPATRSGRWLSTPASRLLSVAATIVVDDTTPTVAAVAASPADGLLCAPTISRNAAIPHGVDTLDGPWTCPTTGEQDGLAGGLRAVKRRRWEMTIFAPAAMGHSFLKYGIASRDDGDPPAPGRVPCFILWGGAFVIGEGVSGSAMVSAVQYSQY